MFAAKVIAAAPVVVVHAAEHRSWPRPWTFTRIAALIMADRVGEDARELSWAAAEETTEIIQPGS